MALKKSELYSSVWASRDDLSGCMDAKIAEPETKPAKAHQVKQGKMQKLLTGKTRLA